MMNCTDFQNQIDEYCSDALGAESRSICEKHLASCPDCTRAVVDLKDLLESLKKMPVLGPSEGFAIRALRIAEESEAVGQNVGHHHRRGFMVGFGSAAAAALALWVVVGVLPQQKPTTTGSGEMASVGPNIGKNVPEFSIALNEQRDIKLAFFSSRDLKGATITLQMPENVALVGYEGQRELAWKTNLVKGDNTLRLPVVASSVTDGQLVAHIEYMGKVKTLRVNLAISVPESGVPNSAPGLSGSAKSEMKIV